MKLFTIARLKERPTDRVLSQMAEKGTLCMSKPMGNLTFAAGVSFGFAAAMGAVIWAMPVWMRDGLLAQWPLGTQMIQMSWKLGLDAGLVAAIAGAGVTLVAVGPLCWMAAKLIWPARRLVTVPPLPDRTIDAVAQRRPFITPHPVAPDPVLELPTFLALSDATAEPPLAEPVLAPSLVQEGVLMIEPAPVQPSLAARPRLTTAPEHAADDDSMADLLERFESRLNRVRDRRFGPYDAAGQARTLHPNLPTFAAVGGR